MKYEAGDRVEVVENTVEDADRRLSGKQGEVRKLRNQYQGRDVYLVLLDGGEYPIALYEEDLKRVVEDQRKVALLHRVNALQHELGLVQKELEDIETAEDVSGLPVGSVVSWKNSVVIKVKEDWWHWFSGPFGEGLSHHSNSKDKAVTDELTERKKNGMLFNIHPANRD